MTMQKKILTITKNAARYFDRYAYREFIAWLLIGRYFAVLLPLILIVVVSVLMYVNPFAPKKAYLAIGQTGSSYGLIGEKFQEIFSKYGIDLELIKTDGLAEGLINLEDPQSIVNASFITAGSSAAKDYPKLISLGSVQFAPIWIFYRGEKLNIDDPFEYFSKRKIGIGKPETNSNKMFRRALLANQQDAINSKGLLELSHLESAEKLKAGELDAVFIIDSFNAPVVQSLLQDPTIHVLSMNLADAYVKKYPFLHKLVIPRGSLNLENILPREEIILLGSTTNLLVEASTHPAIQWAFMLASSEFGKFSQDFFSKPGDFPKYQDSGFPLSPVAKRFFTQGQPTVFDYLPLWLGSIIESAWVLILAFIALIYPLFKWVMSIRAYPSKKFMYKNFIDMRDLDEEIGHIKTKQDITALLERVDQLIQSNESRWLSETEVRFYFVKKNILLGMKRELNEKLKSIG
jgi:TRAP-type uncharacterized transport system substrate-binding protein